MTGLFARCMFESTRVSPLANASTGRDWRLMSDRLTKTQCVELRKDCKTMLMDKNRQKLDDFSRFHHSTGAFLMPNV